MSAQQGLRLRPKNKSSILSSEDLIRMRSFGERGRQSQDRGTYCARTGPLPLLPSGPGGVHRIATRRTRRLTVHHIKEFRNRKFEGKETRRNWTGLSVEMGYGGIMRWRGISTESRSESFLPLAVQLKRIRDNSERYVPAETLAIHERAIAELRQRNAAQAALGVGDRVRDFILPDHNGMQVRSADLLAKGKLIVAFFRGRWCPYCVTQLEALQFIARDLEAKGASLVAISPQTVHHNSLTADQHEISFPLLSDRGNSIADAFGTKHTVPQEQLELYRKVFVNLSHLNDAAPDTLPLPSTFLIARDGVIQWASVVEDYRVRPEPAELLSRA